MTAKSAQEIIRQEYGTARNFMTPSVIKTGKINPNVAFELSTGTGFDHNQIYGVSVVQYDPDTDTTDRHAIESKCFGNRAAAECYISQLKAS